MCLEGTWEFLVASQSQSFFVMLPLQTILISITDWASMDCLQLHKPIKPHLTFAGPSTWCIQQFRQWFEDSE